MRVAKKAKHGAKSIKGKTKKGAGKAKHKGKKARTPQSTDRAARSRSEPFQPSDLAGLKDLDSFGELSGLLGFSAVEVHHAYRLKAGSGACAGGWWCLLGRFAPGQGVRGHEKVPTGGRV